MLEINRISLKFKRDWQMLKFWVPHPRFGNAARKSGCQGTGSRRQFCKIFPLISSPPPEHPSHMTRSNDTIPLRREEKSKQLHAPGSTRPDLEPTPVL